MNADIYSRFTAGRLSAVQAAIADRVISELEEWVKTRAWWVIDIVGTSGQDDVITIDLSFRPPSQIVPGLNSGGLASALYMSDDTIGVMLFRHASWRPHPNPTSYFDVQVDKLVPAMVEGL